jgi:MerR family transcriptional regulator, light-induced transcriptional regulator
MSRHKESSHPPLVAPSASQWVNKNVNSLAEEITEHQFLARPALLEKYGVKGKQKCREDAAFHLHYLSEAVSASSTKIFADYIGWAKIMLVSRGIEYRDLEHTLAAMKRALVKNASRDEGALLASFIDAALKLLPNLPESVPSFVDPNRPFSTVANTYLKSLLLLNRDEAVAYLLREVDAGLSIKDVFEHVILPVQQEVGRLWQLNKITVVQEHYCTAVAELVLTRLQRKYIGTRRDVSALTLCPEGEEHCLGLRLFSEVLEADGWNVTYIGPKSPTRDIVKHLQTFRTDVVAISVATPLNLGKTKQLIDAIKGLSPQRQPRIIVGGAALMNSEPNALTWLGADALATDISEGVAIANRLMNARKKTA